MGLQIFLARGGNMCQVAQVLYFINSNPMHSEMIFVEYRFAFKILKRLSKCLFLEQFNFHGTLFFNFRYGHDVFSLLFFVTF